MRFGRMYRAADAGTGTGGGTETGAAAGGSAAAAGAGGTGGTSGTGTGAPVAFAETLPADIRGEALFKDIKDLEGLSRSYVHAAKMVGLDKASLIALPTTDDEKAWGDVYTRLGRPEAADKYELSKPELPEGFAVNETLQKGFLEEAHKIGLNGKQADALFKWWNKTAAGEHTAARDTNARAMEDAGKALKTEWGHAYDAKVEVAQGAIRHYAKAIGVPVDQLGAELEASGLGNRPGIAKLFAHLGGQLSEDGLLGKGGGGGGAGALSPAEAKQEIATLQNDKAFGKEYMDKRAPGHQAAVEKMQRLYGFAYPDQG